VLKSTTDSDVVEFIITTDDPDLDGDVVEPGGVNFAEYMAGTKAVCYGHDYHTKPPVGVTLTLRKVANGLRATMKFLGHDFARQVKQALDALGASIGFLSRESHPNEHGGRTHTRVVLTEWSLTPVPANQYAVRVLKQAGLLADDDPDADEAITILDDDGTTLGRITPREIARIIGDGIGASIRRMLRELAADPGGLGSDEVQQRAVPPSPEPCGFGPACVNPFGTRETCPKGDKCGIPKPGAIPMAPTRLPPNTRALGDLFGSGDALMDVSPAELETMVTSAVRRDVRARLRDAMGG
jgi:HK97 family phage prohead protease